MDDGEKYMVVIGIDRKKRRGNGGEEQYVEHE